MKTLLFLFAATISISAQARPVELDVLRCQAERPLRITSATPAGTITYRSVRSFGIRQNLNKNYATILVNDRDIGSDAYSRGRGGWISVTGWNTSLEFRLRPVPGSARVESRNVSAAYANYAGTIDEIPVTCRFRIVTSN